jgi:hypothetical protein
VTIGFGTYKNIRKLYKSNFSGVTELKIKFYYFEKLQMRIMELRAANLATL